MRKMIRAWRLVGAVLALTLLMELAPLGLAAPAVAQNAPLAAPATVTTAQDTATSASAHAALVTTGPFIIALSPDFGLPGTQVTITGSGFGNDPGPGARRSSLNKVGVGDRDGIPDASVLSWSDTQIVFTLPPPPPTLASGGVIVVAGGVLSNWVCFRVSATQGPCVFPGDGNSRPGQRKWVYGERFVAGETVTLRWDDPAAAPLPTTLATIVADSDGRFGYNSAVNLFVPLDARLGPHTLLASAPSGSDSVRLRIGPVLSCLNPTSGGAGTPVTLTGKNFGAAQGNSTVNFTRSDGSGSTGIVQSWSDTAIVAAAPADAVTGNVFVRVATRGGNNLTYTLGAPQTTPAITCITPSSGGPGTAITISGYNFGPDPGPGNRNTPSNHLGGIAAFPDANVTSWSDTQITATIPADAANGWLDVVVGGVGRSVIYEVTPTAGGAPQVGLNPPRGRAGTQTTASGSGFTAGQSVELRLDGAGGALLATKTVDPDGTFAQAATIPAGTSVGAHTVQAVVFGYAVQAATFTVGPFITGLTPDFGLSGTQMTISGFGFGADPGPGARGSGTNNVGFFPDANVLSWSDTQITFTPPASGLALASMGLNVTAGGVTSSFVCMRVSATEGPCVFTSLTRVRPGWTVDVVGERFAPGETVTLRWDDPAAPALTTITADSQGRFNSSGARIVTLPNDARVGPHTILAGAPSGGAASRTYVLPALTCVDPPAGAADDLITLTGKDFGALQNGGHVAFTRADGSVTRGSVQSWSDTLITVRLPADAVTGQISVRMGNAPNFPTIFTVSALPSGPVIACVIPNTGPAGAQVIIKGSNFGADPGTGNRSTTSNRVTLSGTTVPDASVLSWSDAQIVFAVPTGAGNGWLRVTAGGRSSSGGGVFGIPYEVTASAGGAPQLGMGLLPVRAGMPTTLSGSGFTAGQRVELRLDSSTGALLATATVNPDGTFAPAATIPAGTSVGGHSLYAVVFSYVVQTFPFTVTATQRLAFVTQPIRGAGGLPLGAQPVVAAKDAQGNTVASDNSTVVTLSVTPGAGTLGAVLVCDQTVGGVTSRTVAAGLAVFTGCAIDLPGGAYTLQAASSGVTAGQTAPFNVTLAGDANGDCRVGAVDFSLVVTHYGKSSAHADWTGPAKMAFRADLNGDGAVGPLDYSALISRFGRTASSCPAASNGNPNPPS